MSLLRNPSEILRRWRPSKDSGILARAPFVKAIDRQGERFFQTGHSLLNTLSMFIESVRTHKFSSLERFYAQTFRGNRLGLTTLKLESERDGISSHSFCSVQVMINPLDAIAEWRKYIESFENVEEISLHLHRLEKWKSVHTVVASVRFEHIGTPRGAKRSCIDRAHFNTEWERDGADESVAMPRESSHPDGPCPISPRPE